MLECLSWLKGLCRPLFKGGNRVSSVGDVRTLWLGGAEESRSHASFPDNRVVTSKYTLWNFLPKNLFEQFRRIANFYFLCMTIIALSIESPVSPATSFVPLIFVIFVTTVKQGYEDWLRHRSDNEVNNSLVTVVRNGCRQRVKSKEVRVGELVMVRRDEDVPCDLVLLASSDAEGRAHVTTANLDGETNLKTLLCPRMLRLFSRPEQLVQLRARIECEHPHADLYRFYGKIEVFPADDSVYASLLDQDVSETALQAEDGGGEGWEGGGSPAPLSPSAASSDASLSVSALDNALKQAASENTAAVPNGFYAVPASPLLLRSGPPAAQRPSLSHRRSYDVAGGSSGTGTAGAPLKRSPSVTWAAGTGTGACAHSDGASQGPCAACEGCRLRLANEVRPPPPPTERRESLQQGFGPEVAPLPAVRSDLETPLRAQSLPDPASLFSTPGKGAVIGGGGGGGGGGGATWTGSATGTGFRGLASRGGVSFAASSATAVAARSAASVVGPTTLRHSLAFGETITNGRRSLKRIGLVLGVNGSAGPDDDRPAVQRSRSSVSATSASGESLRLSRKAGLEAGAGMGAVPVRRFSVGLSAPLGTENLLLRGTRLRNTDYVYGCAVYTGQQSKLALNWRLTSNKFSTIEKTVNKFLLFFLLLLILETGISLALKYAFELQIKQDMTEYLGPVFVIRSMTVLTDFFSFIILYNYIIPISLYVTIEMQKFLGTLFFEWDLQLYDPNTQLAAICNSSDLNEELGQVEVLFTDKTGTLTENDMQFRRCSVGGDVYAEEGGVLTRLGPDMDHRHGHRLSALTAELEEFYVALALCHTVQLDEAPPNNNAPAEGLVYQASSPDEKALAEAAARVGVVFLGEEGDFVTVQVKGKARRFRKLDVLEFTSDRKRMSVLVEDEEGRVRLLCKGAETTVLPLTDTGPLRETQAHVNDFAMRGLRVMLVAERVLERSELHALEQQVELARQTVSAQRAQLVAAAYERLEMGLRLLGATAVEDRLQDGVQETLESLRAAGVAIWILTGDKEETAVNISFSCGHFKNGTELLYLTQHKDLASCVASLQRYRERVLGDRHRQFGMVVDGQSLALALHRPEQLREVAMRCYAVVCCRMSPLQKSEVVQLVKAAPNHPVTAAIGDGANDVSMIQEAHVGLGVMGREGRQAARCSDFAFARFRFLRRVLLVHGHWYYERLATLVQYFFYKNVVFITPQLYFGIFSAFSMHAMYDSVFLTLFNVFFTSLPILLYGLLEQRVPARELFLRPQRYGEIARNSLLRWTSFAGWLLLGLWHSLVIFFFPLLLLHINPVVLSDQPMDLLTFGCLVFHNVVVVCNLKLLLHSRHWTVPFVFSIALSIVGFVVIALTYSSIRLTSIMDNTMYMVYNKLLASPSFWLISFITVAICLVPDLTYSVTCKHITLKTLKRLRSSFSWRKHGHLTISSTASSVNG